MIDSMYGCRASHRNRWQLLEAKILSEKQFLLYECLIDLADRGERHKKYGMFEFFPDELVGLFHKTSETICDWFNRLRQLGFVKLIDHNRSLYQIVKYDRYSLFYGRGYASQEKGLAIRRVLAGWELVGDYSVKRIKRKEKIPENAVNLLKTDIARVSVSSKKESNVLEGYEFGEVDLANIFFGGDMREFYLHWSTTSG